MDNDLLLQTLQRIEGKVDSSIVNHGERLAAAETKIDAVQTAVDKADTRQWIHSLATYAGVMASHLGLNKIGWKI